MSRPDLDSLLNFLLPFAQDMLAKHGEFFPFAATMSGAGEVAKAASYTGSEHPANSEVLEALEAGLRRSARSSEIRAAAVCINARVQAPGATEKTDAIQVKLEHSDGEAIEVFLPYRRNVLRRLKYGELFATQGTRTLFPH